MVAERIFHITEPSLWAAAKDQGSYQWSTRGKSLADVGFIHCSFREQVDRVASFVYADFVGELILLEIDPALIDAEIRLENLDGGDENFPHVYGPLPIGAVIDVQPYDVGGDRSVTEVAGALHELFTREFTPRVSHTQFVQRRISATVPTAELTHAGAALHRPSLATEAVPLRHADDRSDQKSNEDCEKQPTKHMRTVAIAVQTWTTIKAVH